MGVTLKTRDAIASSVRIEWTLEEFYADGGTSALIDRLASVLGIHASRVQVLEVYEGSVVARVLLLDEDEDGTAETSSTWSDKEATMAAVTAALTSADVGDALHAPVLAAEVEGTTVVGSKIPPPPKFDALDFGNIDYGKSPKAGTNGDDANLLGSHGDDAMLGFDGDDTIRGRGGADDILGYEGDDRLHGDNRINGGEGADYVSGGGGADELAGGEGNDILAGGDGDDKLRGDGGKDKMHGGSGEDALWGGEGKDVLNGQPGDDWLFGEGGDDVLNGGDGNDKLYGGAGYDRLRGNAGDDELHGGSGNDALDGGTGRDALIDDEGDAEDEAWFTDVDGGDTWTGGPGKDVFIFKGPTTLGPNVITALGTNDMLRFQNSCGNTYVAVGTKIAAVLEPDNTSGSLEGPWEVTVDEAMTTGTVCRPSTDECL